MAVPSAARWCLAVAACRFTRQLCKKSVIAGNKSLATVGSTAVARQRVRARELPEIRCFKKTPEQPRACSTDEHFRLVGAIAVSKVRRKARLARYSVFV